MTSPIHRLTVGEPDQLGRETVSLIEVLDDPGPDPRAVGASDVRLPVSSVEPVVGLTCAVWVAGLCDHDTDQGRPTYQHQQRGSTLQPEGTSLPHRVTGTHMHPRLRRPPSWSGPSGRAGSQA